MCSKQNNVKSTIMFNDFYSLYKSDQDTFIFLSIFFAIVKLLDIQCIPLLSSVIHQII